MQKGPGPLLAGAGVGARLEVFALLILLGMAVIVLVQVGVWLLGRREGGEAARLLVVRCRWAFRCSVAAGVGLASAYLISDAETRTWVVHLLRLFVVGSLAWWAIRFVGVAEDAGLSRNPMDMSNNRRARIRRTQISLLAKTADVLFVVLAVVAALASFASVRAFGASLIASAGLIGIVAGLAAQSTLTNLFAGLQLAFTGALRIDDVVVVQGEWGRVEEIHLTYIVIRVWDRRTLVLHSRWFTENPFQNWTRDEARVLGSVFLTVDYTVPVQELRDELGRFLETTPLWDRRDWVLQVTNVTAAGVELRALMSSVDAPTNWDLKCAAREHLITWLAQTHPGALFRSRLMSEEREVERDEKPRNTGGKHLSTMGDGSVAEGFSETGPHPTLP